MLKITLNKNLCDSGFGGSIFSGLNQKLGRSFLEQKVKNYSLEQRIKSFSLNQRVESKKQKDRGFGLGQKLESFSLKQKAKSRKQKEENQILNQRVKITGQKNFGLAFGGLVYGFFGFSFSLGLVLKQLKNYVHQLLFGAFFVGRNCLDVFQKAFYIRFLSTPTRGP